MKVEFTKKGQYRRYIIFEWTEYDNEAPFRCVVDSFDDIEQAKKRALNTKKIYNDFVAIFDRVAGELFMVEATE